MAYLIHILCNLLLHLTFNYSPSHFRTIVDWMNHSPVPINSCCQFDKKRIVTENVDDNVDSKTPSNVISCESWIKQFKAIRNINKSTQHIRYNHCCEKIVGFSLSSVHFDQNNQNRCVGSYHKNVITL